MSDGNRSAFTLFCDVPLRMMGALGVTRPQVLNTHVVEVDKNGNVVTREVGLL